MKNLGKIAKYYIGDIEGFTPLMGGDGVKKVLYGINCIFINN